MMQFYTLCSFDQWLDSVSYNIQQLFQYIKQVRFSAAQPFLAPLMTSQ